MRHALIAFWLLLGCASPAFAQLSLNFSVPGVSIGINVPVYPELQRVPGYPVYYAPAINSNYFFYDGLYWLYSGEDWYASSWYDGPWALVDPLNVPVFLLRVPVRYYRHAPAFFHGWRADDAPRWGDHWGQSWEKRRTGWDRWDRASAPAPAPLPTYQRQYSGNTYPQPSQQAAIEQRSYRYQPKDAVAQQHFQQAARTQSPAAQAQPQAQPRVQPQQAQPQAVQSRQPAPVAHEQQAAKPQPQHAAPPQQAEHKPQPTPAHEQQASQAQPHPQQAERKPPQVQAERKPPQVQAERKPPQVQEERKPPQVQEERKPPQVQAAHEAQAPKPQAKDKPPPKERGNEPGHEEGHEPARENK
jgi:hypothetical protein